MKFPDYGISQSHLPLIPFPSITFAVPKPTAALPNLNRGPVICYPSDNCQAGAGIQFPLISVVVIVTRELIN